MSQLDRPPTKSISSPYLVTISALDYPVFRVKDYVIHCRTCPPLTRQAILALVRAMTDSRFSYPMPRLTQVAFLHVAHVLE